MPPPISRGQYGDANACQTPLKRRTSALYATIWLSSSANRFQSAPRYTSAATTATVPYNRALGSLESTVHPEHRAAAAPLFDHPQPARVALDQRVQLGDRLGYVTGNHHVARTLSLQVGALLGRGRRGHRPPAVAIDVERHAQPAGVEPDERLEVGG